MTSTFNKILTRIREEFRQPEGFISLHEPRFIGNERKYLIDAIDSTYVSSVGEYVNRFEEMMKQITGAGCAIATVNGTAALHISLVLAGVEYGDEVITQPLTFVATANAIRYAGADPHFVDVDLDTMGLSPEKLKTHLEKTVVMENGRPFNRHTGKRISACVPMHTFGLPLRIDEVVEVCSAFNIPVVEDAAESLGSTYKTVASGNFGLLGAFSFNGNKTVTSGAGGAVITNDVVLGKRAKHLTTTAKLPHPWEFVHDEVAYNYRMPNLNAALACAQLEQLDLYLEDKRTLADSYAIFFEELGIRLVKEIQYAKANYWLCTILLANREQRDEFLDYSNSRGVMTRPAWRLMPELVMFSNCYCGEISNAKWLEDRIVNIPSSFRIPHVNEDKITTKG